MRDSRWAADETINGISGRRSSFPRQDSIPRRYTRTSSNDSDSPLDSCNRPSQRPAERSLREGRDMPFTAPIRTTSGNGPTTIRAPRRVRTDSLVNDTIQHTIAILDEALEIIGGC
jgi:hypothetical protein